MFCIRLQQNITGRNDTSKNNVKSSQSMTVSQQTDAVIQWIHDKQHAERCMQSLIRLHFACPQRTTN